MSYQHPSDTLLPGYVVLLNLLNTGTILSVAGGIFLMLSIVKVVMDIYYHPRHKGYDQPANELTDHPKTSPDE